MSKDQVPAAGERRSALNMPGDEFRALGHALVDRIAEFYDTLGEREVTRGATPEEIRERLGGSGLPEQGADPKELLDAIVPLLFDYSLHNGHPKFMGYITSSAAPLGALADLLASALNANMARWEVSPAASELEAQAVRWVAEFIGYDPDASGLMVSGGNMANFVAFVAARTKMASWDIRRDGNYADPRRLTAYATTETHAWLQKAVDVCGLGADALRNIAIDSQGRMRIDRLREQLAADRHDGRLPFLVVGTGGSVGTGAIDPLRELAALCEKEQLWFHVDGAYGAPAAVLPEAPDDLHALSLADSVAVDPHKWLYCPIEVACVLTRHSGVLKDAFGFSPHYYRLAGRKVTGIDYSDLGMQNTRGFRALKVWLMLRATGRAAYAESIRQDIRLARRLSEGVDAHAELEMHAANLSITTFRYVPPGLGDIAADETAAYLDTINQAVLAELQAGGRLFLTNAVVDGRYLLRACVVNFRTTEADIDSVPETVVEIGRKLDRELRPGAK